MKQLLNSAKLIIIIAFSGFVFQCSEEEQTDKKLLARAFDEYLYFEDIQEMLPANISPADSAEQVSRYVRDWTKKQLLRKKAELNLTDEQKDVSTQLEDYRTSLLIHKYKQKFINQRLDTVITDDDIAEFYESHKNDYVLTKSAIKAMLIKIPSDMDRGVVYNIRRYYRSDKEQDSLKVVNFCYENDIPFFHFDHRWIYFNDFIMETPIDVSNPEMFLKTRNSFEAADENYIYFVRIIDYRLKGDISPVTFVKPIIRNIIFNKRKIELITDLENELFNEAIINKNIEITGEN